MENLKQLIPLDLMAKRVQRYGSESDSSLFTELLYAGEFVTKLTTAGLISAIEDDRENHRYRFAHSLVRADSIGEWARAVDEILTGPASSQLASSFGDVRRSFSERLGDGSWQHEAVHALKSVLDGVHKNDQNVGAKVAFRSWFQLFSELRNKTRGHGALTPANCGKLVPALQASIQAVINNNPVFQLPWAYLHRNLSGKYRVVDVGGDTSEFAKLKSAAAASGEHFPDGIYLWADGYRRVELVHTDPDVSDFFFPNGAFGTKSYELHSIITDNRKKGDASAYFAPAIERPPSETQGADALDTKGETVANLPALAAGYVSRPQLESEVSEALSNDRHPIVTMVGRGGIGKTSVALRVLDEIAATERFHVIIWFSARDIDLTTAGAKQVKPRVLTDKEIASEYYELVKEFIEKTDDKVDKIELISRHLTESPLGPTLFVFDNFETVRNPIDLFQWIDNSIRLPNKAVITSRFRDFKADYPIEVFGMEDSEAETLVSNVSHALGIQELIGMKQRTEIVESSSGHPYVIKIVLGEIADAKAYSKPSKLIARKEDILDALFERTYANLAPLAARIFLTLSGWRSMVPQLAVEAVLLRHGAEVGDPEAAIDQLIRMSLIERSIAGDTSDFLDVPLAAALFGRRKLEVSPSKTLIESDLKFLQDIGVTDSSGLKNGIGPRIKTFFRKTAQKIGSKNATIEEMRPVLEFLAGGYPEAWLLLSDLTEELTQGADVETACEYVRRYLETSPEPDQAEAAWSRLAYLYREQDDVIAACGAFLKAAETNSPPINEVSTMANLLNHSPTAKDGVELMDRKILFKPFAELFETYIDDTSATDLSRLAWLHLHSGDSKRALEVAEMGIERDPYNVHCQRLVVKLEDQRV